MKIFPAIDILDRQIVRLTEGDFDQKTVYNKSVFEQATYYQSLGFKYIHLINLSGTLDPKASVFDIIEQISTELDFTIQFGGGIRDISQIETLVSIGIDRIILSTMLFNSDFDIADIVKRFPNTTFVAALDSKDNQIYTHGWKKGTGIDVFDFIPKCAEWGIADFLVTDISKDGKMAGPNIDLYRDFNSTFPNFNFIASGGITTMTDVNELIVINVDSCVIGKAIYEGTINPEVLAKKGGAHA